MILIQIIINDKIIYLFTLFHRAIGQFDIIHRSFFHAEHGYPPTYIFKIINNKL